VIVVIVVIVVSYPEVPKGSLREDVFGIGYMLDKTNILF